LGARILSPVPTPAERFHDEIPRWFLPGAVYTFIGAGGKSTAMRRVSALLVETGLKARMTTTTRVGIAEFAGCPVALSRERSDLQDALDREDTVLLLAAYVIAQQDKYAGIDPLLIDALRLRADTVLLVEADGSRRRAVKVPREREPVIPSCSHSVLAFMGASAFDEPLDELHCYNHEQALALLGRTVSFLKAEEIALLASRDDGCRKGVLPGMTFRLVISQGDLVEKRPTAVDAMHIMKERCGVEAALVSFQKGELYGTTAD
jgi:probable selenium-dependent hydroxylase accessory protein YqeC